MAISSALTIGAEFRSLSDSLGLPLLRFNSEGDSVDDLDNAGDILSEAVGAEGVDLFILVTLLDVCLGFNTADDVVSIFRRLGTGSSSRESSLRERLPADTASASLRSSTGSVFGLTRLLESEGVDSSLGVTENAVPCAGTRRGHG